VVGDLSDVSTESDSSSSELVDVCGLSTDSDSSSSLELVPESVSDRYVGSPPAITVPINFDGSFLDGKKHQFHLQTLRIHSLRDFDKGEMLSLARNMLIENQDLMEENIELIRENKQLLQDDEILLNEMLQLQNDFLKYLPGIGLFSLSSSLYTTFHKFCLSILSVSFF